MQIKRRQNGTRKARVKAESSPKQVCPTNDKKRVGRIARYGSKSTGSDDKQGESVGNNSRLFSEIRKLVLLYADGELYRAVSCI